MLTKAETGKLGEDAVCRYLERGRYRIVCRNYHTRYGEIDIIAESENYIAFVEVKTRCEGSWVTGAQAVDIRKRRKIYKTAILWLMENKLDKQPRFDVAEVTTEKTGSDKITGFNYIVDAFGGEVCNEIF